MLTRNTSNNTPSGQRYIFTQGQLTRLIAMCRNIAAWLARQSHATTSYTETTDAINITATVECALAYLYAEVYKYGHISSVLNANSEVFARYILASSLVFSEPEKLSTCIKQLSLSWQKATRLMRQALGSDIESAITINAYAQAITSAITQLEKNDSTHNFSMSIVNLKGVLDIKSKKR